VFFKNPQTSTWGFIAANLLLVGAIYHRIEEPLQFFFIAGGLVTFSFFLKRAIDQIIGV
jgi:hypothetical protein